MVVQDQRLRRKPQRLDIYDYELTPPEGCQRPVVRDGRQVPCGKTVCDCRQGKDGMVAVWSVSGRYVGDYPARNAWTQSLAGDIDALVEDNELFGWDDPEGLRAWIRFVCDPEVFAALVGVEIE